jgi:DNA-binding LacI/PurR family transcriptional regulator
MANIRDVAKLSGVSIATVSRILNYDDTYSTTQATKDKVFDAITTLNYSVKLAYKRKPDTHKKSIACIINLTAEKHDDSYYTAILESIKLELSKSNYSVDYIKSQHDIKQLELLRALFKSPVHGLILMTTLPPEALAIINENSIPVVGVDTTLTCFDNVRYNRFEAGCQAMQCLLQNGHEKIAFIGANISSEFNLQFGRYDAYRTMMRRAHLEVNPDWIIDCRWERPLCYEHTKKLIRLKDRPTAIFVASDHMAMASISAMYDDGIKVPDDISIIGISDIEEAKYFTPPLTTIHIPQKEIGEIVSHTLLSRINGDTTPPKQIYIPTKLIMRQSIKNLAVNNDKAYNGK